MLYIEGHRSTIFSSHTRSSPLSCCKKNNIKYGSQKNYLDLYFY